jgi:hypothetical protein
MLTLDKVANFLSISIDWDLFFSTVDSLGDSLNSHKNRFDKSDILELAIVVFSNQEIIYHNKNYRDFFIPSLNGIYCEMKYGSHLLFNKAGVPKSFITLTLINTMGINEKRNDLPEGYSDFLIAVDSQGCAVIDKSTLSLYLDSLSDSGQIKAKNIPSDKFTFVRKPYEIKRKLIKNLDYSQAKIKLQKEFLSNIKEGYKKT